MGDRPGFDNGKNVLCGRGSWRQRKNFPLWPWVTATKHYFSFVAMSHGDKGYFFHKTRAATHPCTNTVRPCLTSMISLWALYTHHHAESIMFMFTNDPPTKQMILQSQLVIGKEIWRNSSPQRKQHKTQNSWTSPKINIPIRENLVYSPF